MHTGIAKQREERRILEEDARVRLGERRELLESVLVEDLSAQTRLAHALLCTVQHSSVQAHTLRLRATQKHTHSVDG